ncbi:hypothetical protein [Aeromicrobium sp. Leaf350]|uniref:hypothetical protein n=1 Tax=Aeromicrobium sp. Leaf350 TaxID=2876565 RepID=UPI001E3E4A34|nr:hypothetical protein [Aeromicrobium sp. Leaf350]
MIKWIVRIGAGVSIGLLLSNGPDPNDGRVIGLVVLAVGVYEGVIHWPRGGGDDDNSGPFRPA